MDRVVSRPQERQHEHPTLMRRLVVHQIRTRMVMEEPPRWVLLPERRIRMVLTVARPPHGTLRRARPIHIRMVAKHRRLGAPLHGRLIRIKMEVKPLRGTPAHGLPTHIRTMNPRAGVTMGAERLVGAEDGVVALRVITHGRATRHLHGQPTQVIPHGLHRRQQLLQHRLLLRPQLRRIQMRRRLVPWGRQALCTQPRPRGSRLRTRMIQHLHGYWIQPSKARRC